VSNLANLSSNLKNYCEIPDFLKEVGDSVLANDPDRYKLLRVRSETSGNAGKCLRKVSKDRDELIGNISERNPPQAEWL
jgi:hypothetical protein